MTLSCAHPQETRGPADVLARVLIAAGVFLAVASLASAQSFDWQKWNLSINPVIKNYPQIELAKPKIISFSPASGPPGTVVTITGQSFDRMSWSGLTAPHQVFFGSGQVNFVANWTYVSPTQIRATVPQGAVTGPIVIKQNGQVITQSATNFVVPLPPPVVRIVNNSQYDLVDIRINGQPQLQPGYILQIGDTWDITRTAGSTTVYLGAGLIYSDGSFDEIGSRTFTFNLANGSVQSAVFQEITLGELMTNGQQFTDWTGSYWVGLTPHAATFRIFLNGQWSLFDDGTLLGSGTLQLVSWPDNSASLQFRFAAGDPAVQLSYPFSGFQFANGPNNSTIFYTRQ